ncbi:hypothetical protein HK102_010055 [Quaeritorhiza haematococci]|nr:hypothetical protein HK102_010055 [Quaeritorhiza haematococci]
MKGPNGIKPVVGDGAEDFLIDLTRRVLEKLPPPNPIARDHHHTHPAGEDESAATLLHRHEFYSAVMPLPTTMGDLVYGVNESESDKEGGTDERRREKILEVLFRLRQIGISRGVVGGKGEEKPAGGVADLDDVDLALEAYDVDSVMAFAHLLMLEKDEDAKKFFDTLYPSPLHEQLACYYFSLRALLHLMAILDETPLEKINIKVEKYTPIEVVHVANNLTAKITDAINNIHDANDAHHHEDRIHALQRARNALEIARHYTGMFQDKQQERLLQSIYDRGDVDATRFADDEDYKREVVLGMMHTVEGEEIERAVKVGEHFGYAKYEMIISHVSWLFVATSVSLPVLRSKLSSNLQTLLDHPDDTTMALLELHPKIGGREHQKLLLLYQTLLQCAQKSSNHHPDRGTLLQQLDIRISLLNSLESRPSLAAVLDIKEMIAATYEGIHAFVNVWKREGCVKQVLIDLGQVMGSLLRLQLLPGFFGDEKMEKNKIVLLDQEHVVVSTLYLAYFDFIYNGLNWNAPDVRSVMAMISEFRPALVKLVPEHLIQVLRKQTVGPKAMVVPFQERTKLVAYGKELMESKRGGRMVQSTQASNELEKISKHFQLVSDLSRISDPSSKASLGINWLQQYDLGYESDLVQIAHIAARVVASGASPYVVHEMCKLLSHAYPQAPETLKLSIFSTATLYEQVARILLNCDHVKVFEGIFATDETPTTVTLERILKAVTEYVPIDLSIDDMMGDGWGGGGLDVEDEFATVLSTVESTLRGVITEVAEDTAKSSPDLRLELVGLLHKLFNVEEDDARRLENIKLVGVVKRGWDYDVPASQLENKEQRRNLFEHLLSQATHGEQYQALFEILLDWSSSSVTEEEENEGTEFETQAESAPEADEAITLEAPWLEEELVLEAPWLDDEPTKIVASAPSPPKPSPVKSSGPVKKCWENMLMALTKTHLFDLLFAVHLTFANLYTISEPWETKLLDALESVSPTTAIKHGLISPNNSSVQRAMSSLKSQINILTQNVSSLSILLGTQPPMPGLQERVLHISICARGFAPGFVQSSLWPHIVRTLLTPGGRASGAPLYRALVVATVANLTLAGRLSAAAGLSFEYLNFAKELRGGIAIRVGIVRQVLKVYVDELGSGTAGSTSRDVSVPDTDTSEDALECKILLQYLCAVGSGQFGQRKLDEVGSSVRAKAVQALERL